VQAATAATGRWAHRKWALIRLASPSRSLRCGYPHLEEAYWFAEGVLPILKRKEVA